MLALGHDRPSRRVDVATLVVLGLPPGKPSSLAAGVLDVTVFARVVAREADREGCEELEDDGGEDEPERVAVFDGGAEIAETTVSRDEEAEINLQGMRTVLAKVERVE